MQATAAMMLGCMNASVGGAWLKLKYEDAETFWPGKEELKP